MNERFVCTVLAKSERLSCMEIGRVIDAKRALTVGVRNTDEACAQARQSPDFLAQFEYQYACTLLCCAESRAQTRQAAADNDDVGLRGKRI